jgi:hypothetical protein
VPVAEAAARPAPKPAVLEAASSEEPAPRKRGRPPKKRDEPAAEPAAE